MNRLIEIKNVFKYITKEITTKCAAKGQSISTACALRIVSFMKYSLSTMTLFLCMYKKLCLGGYNALCGDRCFVILCSVCFTNHCFKIIIKIRIWDFATHIFFLLCMANLNYKIKAIKHILVFSISIKFKQILWKPCTYIILFQLEYWTNIIYERWDSSFTVLLT